MIEDRPISRQKPGPGTDTPAIQRFPVRFKAERSLFLECMEGIENRADREDYATLLLARLIFTYFLQKQGLLAHDTMPGGDTDYLLHQLKKGQAAQNQEASAAFYHTFLPAFFQQGLPTNQPVSPGIEGTEKLPWPALGLFSSHELEQRYPQITIPDQAFERLFTFFNAYTWHLDHARPQDTGEIDPEILSLLGAQEHAQKQMGAYYTGKDVAEYISTATIIPAFLEAVEQREPAAFGAQGDCWQLLARNPDRYLYQALQKGCSLPLPPEIEVGVQHPAHRLHWNEPAPEAYSLAGETWREVVARRQSYTRNKARLSQGEIVTTNDLITCNLDLRQFALDIITHCQEQAFLMILYESLTHLTILDPTCGSGAFLFAALQILEPLYTACLTRMRHLLARPPAGTSASRAGIQHILNQLEQSPGCRYFLYKSMMAHNIYGLDLMSTAVEICRLRLFLLLLSTIQPGADITAMTDFTCHIRAGNTLVGYTWRDRIAYTEGNAQRQLDRHLAAQYGLTWTDQQDDGYRKFLAWRQSHRPFHWQHEHPEIRQNNGFDVIIGNPPYLPYQRVKDTYQLRNYATLTCGNLYAYVLERALALLHPTGRCGLIVPVSAIASERYRPLSRLLLKRQVWASSYSNRPSKLFAQAEQRLTILLIKEAPTPTFFAAPYRHWYEQERAHLFETLRYTPASIWPGRLLPLKSGSEVAEALFTRINRFYGLPLLSSQPTDAAVWVHNGPTYWVRALPFLPHANYSQRSRHYQKVPVHSQEDAFVLAAILSSSTFYFFYKLVSNCRDLGQKELRAFPLGNLQPGTATQLRQLGYQLARRLQETAVDCSRRYLSGRVEYTEYYPAQAKTYIDSIDRVLAEHYQFTAEELDFILNYEIKYRMGYLNGSHSDP